MHHSATSTNPPLKMDSHLWQVFRRGLFQFNPEQAHHLAFAGLKIWQKVGAHQPILPEWTRHPNLAGTKWGLQFPNPVGLAAGLDKDGEAILAFQALGFGFVEVGTVTPKPQSGNPKPRLFRLPESRAVINRMGFNNQGADALVRRAARVKDSGKLEIPLGVNIGKNATTPIEEAMDDYLTCFKKVRQVADFLVVNVSSPNTKNLRSLQQATRLKVILEALQEENQRGQPIPLLVKMSPDLQTEDCVQSLETAVEAGFQGAIISNTTISREGIAHAERYGPGGLSGAPLFQSSTQKLKEVVQHFVDTPLDFIGVGGVMNGEQAVQKRAAGASLIQAYTGFVYGGPTFAAQLCQALVQATRLLPE